MSSDLNQRAGWVGAAAASRADGFEWEVTAKLAGPDFICLQSALPEDRLTPVFEGFPHSSLSMRSISLRG
jgi:hypothetical protein